ncbi:Asp-tRNA(Asn)/Glu-tRNA(Gln) amidotransferase subunit GatB [Candidatus Woesearchaeota archaeon]|nr:Asp-tRNA(Asn)/Glu-tRNA(Gln) amidotransferase subunit GatB [Candidatus Woesearchaeota archaeon]
MVYGSQFTVHSKKSSENFTVNSKLQTPNQFTSEVVIGIECHVELDTKTKLFCSCSTKGNENPNTRVCPICLGHPGSKPVMNKKAFDYAIKLCMALCCKLDTELIFSRKSYFYPDMSKNYQITQFERPLGVGGHIKTTEKLIKLKRIHLEEDPASITYPGEMYSSNYSLLDYNRAGNPLVEIVTEPDIESPKQAREFLNKLILILSYLKIFDINTCIIKADANVSVKESGYSRVEIKNITGFKELERALVYEVTRQKALIKAGRKIERETRSWDSISKTTKKLRTKETEEDYGYIIDPDLCIVDVTKKLTEDLKKEIPELAHQKVERFIKTYKIDPVDAEVMVSEIELADLFEKVSKKANPALTAKWLRRELLRVLNYNNTTIKNIKFGEKELTELITLVDKKTITESTAQKIMEELIQKPFSPKEYVEKNKLAQLSNQAEIEDFCKQAIKENPKALQDYKNGEEKALQYLIGQVMKLTKGKASPEVVNRMIRGLVDGK